MIFTYIPHIALLVAGILMNFCTAPVAAVEIQVEHRTGEVPFLFFEPFPSSNELSWSSGLPNESWNHLAKEHHAIRFSIADTITLHLFACETIEYGKFFEVLVPRRQIKNAALTARLIYLDEGIVSTDGAMPHVLTADLAPMAVSAEGLQWIFDRLPEVRKLSLPLVPPEGLEAITLPKKVETLVIHNVHFGRRFLMQLAELQNLKHLTLSSCHITREALRGYGFENSPKSEYSLARLADDTMSRLLFAKVKELRIFNCSELLHRMMRVQSWPTLLKLELDRIDFFRVPGVRPTSKPPPPIDLRLKSLEEVIYYARTSEHSKWQDIEHTLESVSKHIQRDCLTNELPIKLVVVEETGKRNESGSDH